MPYTKLISEGRLCQECDKPIEEGRFQNPPPSEAKYCLKCRAERRRRANLKYVWRLEYDEYLKAHYYGGLNRRFQVLNRMTRETGLPRWYINYVANSVMWRSDTGGACWNSLPLA